VFLILRRFEGSC